MFTQIKGLYPLDPTTSTFKFSASELRTEDSAVCSGAAAPAVGAVAQHMIRSIDSDAEDHPASARRLAWGVKVVSPPRVSWFRGASYRVRGQVGVTCPFN